jgi:hypothetical protein
VVYNKRAEQNRALDTFEEKEEQPSLPSYFLDLK